MKEIYFSGGSFWGLQKYFDLIFGVIKTEVGYINGRTLKTNYLRLDKTGHIESVHIIYNPKIISLESLLEYYYMVVDPTSYNKQGEDVGRRYRLGIYYTDQNDLQIIINSLENLQLKISGDVVIEAKKLKNFVKAEKYHQNFLKNNPFGYCYIKSSLFEKVKEKQLENISYRVMKHKADEKAFENKYFDNFKEGIYVDKETLIPLFSSKDKYNAKTGEPTFSRPINEQSVSLYTKVKNLKFQVEVLSNEGKNHLGYLFYDGPKRLGGLRYSINSAALTFIPKEMMIQSGYEEYLSYL